MFLEPWGELNDQRMDQGVAWGRDLQGRDLACHHMRPFSTTNVRDCLSFGLAGMIVLYASSIHLIFTTDTDLPLSETSKLVQTCAFRLYVA